MPWEQNIHAANRALSSGLFEQAHQRYTQAINEGRSFAQGDSLWGDAHRGLCRAAMELGHYLEASDAAAIALSTDEAFWGSDCACVAEDHYLAAEALRLQCQFESAKSHYDKALAFWSQQGGDHNELSLQALSGQLLLFLQSKRESGYIELHARAFAAYQVAHPTGMWMKFLRLQTTLDKYLEQGEIEEATEILNREIAVCSSTLGRNHKELKSLLEYQSQLLQQSKKFLAAWRLTSQISKAQEEGLFFSDSRSYSLAPEQAITVMSNLLHTRGNFMPANAPKILHRTWWHVIKSDALAHRLHAQLEFVEPNNFLKSGFASVSPKNGKLELEIKSKFDGVKSQITFEWRLHDSNNVSLAKEVMLFTLTEFDQTFSILPNLTLRHLSVDNSSPAAAWPSPQMYNEAIQNAQTAFLDPQLKIALPELNAIGLPRPMSGAFATVYRLVSEESAWAVKCFTEPVIDQQLRYSCISRKLEEAKLPFFTNFEFQANGILVQEQTYPILKMGWVSGQTLNGAVASHLGNREALSAMSAAFIKIVKAMEVHGIAHGDLQHGNILVGVRDIILVDYDCMFVPELAGKESNEIGHRNYQHPGRSGKHFGPYLDNFSVWVIYISLFVLARYPEYWSALDCGDESLLFKQKDFLSPSESKTFAILAQNQDPEIKEAVSTLIQFLRLGPENIPSVSAFFKNLKI